MTTEELKQAFARWAEQGENAGILLLYDGETEDATQNLGGSGYRLAALLAALLMEGRNRDIVKAAIDSAKKLKEVRRAQAAARSQAN